jgi:orotate phosphoribosyltransferase
MTTTNDHWKTDLIKVLLHSGALLTGDFELKSGRRSPYFVDFGKVPDGDSLDKLGRCYAHKLVNDFDTDSFDLLFGPAYKAIPIAVATVIALARDHGIDKRYAFDRKVEKTYGEKSRFIGGALEPGTRALILDDVITDGGTKFETIDLLQAQPGVSVVGVLVGVDRTEDAAVVESFERRTKLRLSSVCTIADVDAVIRHDHVAA